MRIRPIAAIIVLFLVVASLLASGCTTSTPANEFKTGVNHPQEIRDLMSKKGTVVIHFVLTDCHQCKDMTTKVADLQSQYPDVTFATFNADDNATSSNIFKAYGITGVPAIAVTRGDGATAIFGNKPVKPDETGVDLNAVNSAIEDAQKWQQSHPTPTPAPTIATPTTPTDYSSYFDKAFEGGNAIVDRPFTKSTNVRGNDVYKGITRNASLPETKKMTTVIELTKSQAEAKQLYDQTVNQKLSEGFTPRPDWVAQTKAQAPFITQDWEGLQYGYGQPFSVEYYYDSYVSSWLFLTNAGSSG